MLAWLASMLALNVANTRVWLGQIYLYSSLFVNGALCMMCNLVCAAL